MIHQGVLGRHHEETLIAQSCLAQVYTTRGKLSEAELLVRDDLIASRKVHGSDHPDTLVAMSNLCNLLTAQKRLDEAEPMTRAHVAKCREVHGDQHPHTLVALGNLVDLLRRRGADVEVEPLLREQMENSAIVFGPRHKDTIEATERLAALLTHLDRLDEALVTVRRLHGDTHAWTIKLLGQLVKRLCDNGRPEEAEPHVRRLVVATRVAFGESNTLSEYSRQLLVSVRSQCTVDEGTQCSG